MIAKAFRYGSLALVVLSAVYLAYEIGKIVGFADAAGL